MSLETRSAMIQARVVPWVKRESHHVLQAMGLTMSEAMELFLRRLIEDRKIPFEIVALDRIAEYQAAEREVVTVAGPQVARGGSGKKNSKHL